MAREEARGEPAGPVVSVVMSTYRRAQLLPRFVDALEAQTLGADAFEVVIVDNGSDDETADVLNGLVNMSKLDLRVLTVDVNDGPAKARNLGWRAARAPVVAFTDDDCVPDPHWLEAGLRMLLLDDRFGIVQGRTIAPAGAPTNDWTAYREVLRLSGHWEGCNLFVRRAALDASGGFDEDIGWYGEDTALGWGVVSAGWEGVFADDAVVIHDRSERGVRWHMRQGYLEGNNVGLAKRFPEFRATFWRPWATRPVHAASALAAVGIAATPWKRSAAVLAIPWLWMRRPPWGHHRYLRLLGERAAVDAAVLAGMLAGSVRHRKLIL